MAKKTGKAPKGMHMMSGRKMPMKDSEMTQMMKAKKMPPKKMPPKKMPLKKMKRR